MKRYRLDPKKPKQLTPAEARRLDAMPIDYSDIPPLGDEFFAKATEVWPPAKQQLTIRLDADVLNWLKAHGRATRRVSTGFYGQLWRASRRAGHVDSCLPRTPNRAAPSNASLAL